MLDLSRQAETNPEPRRLRPKPRRSGQGQFERAVDPNAPPAETERGRHRCPRPLAEPEKPSPRSLINIDKSSQEMTVFVDGVETYSWTVSTGRPEYATPSGNYTPTSMNEMWYSKQWDNSPMPHSVFFMKDGHAIHGTHEVKNLGKAASHGCVRLSPENASTLFMPGQGDWSGERDVVLTGKTPGGEYKGVATARPDQYPQYPDGYRGQAVAPPWFDPQPGSPGSA